MPLLQFDNDQLRPPIPIAWIEPIKPSTVKKLILLLPLIVILLLQLLFAYSFLITMILKQLLLNQKELLYSIIILIIYSILVTLSTSSLLIANLNSSAVPYPTYSRMDYRSSNNNVVVTQTDEEDDDDVPLLYSLNNRNNINLINQQQQQQRNSNSISNSQQVKADGQERFCKKCNVPKADRAHHDSMTNRCYLKFDHYCPMVSTPIGYSNLKPFILFLIYTGLECLFVSIISIIILNHFVENEGGFELAPITWAAQAMFGMIVGLSVLSFGLYHIFLASKNRTTIEAMERAPNFKLTPPPSTTTLSNNDSTSRPITYYERRTLQRKIGKINVYDVGWRRNLEQVFGERLDEGSESWGDVEGGLRRRRRGILGSTRKYWIYLLPIGLPPGNGVSFPINPKAFAQLESLSNRLAAGIVSVHHDSISSDDDD